MNMLLASFFMNLKKFNGENYEPDTMKSIFCSIKRFLKDRDYGTNLMTSEIFHHAREMLATKQKIAKSHG
ncbi:hypothetical protein DPMN_006518 [Dreissena polymorpha]|uniref:QRICH1-like domain-containing protein n=1 Tax=Dreissena polymorpha TaxID=45954 RepID=A0A9D4MU58_DREPO|nr:hypothetical protein DPMN_006518 [Dreissena polymorpha]